MHVFSLLLLLFSAAVVAAAAAATAWLMIGKKRDRDDLCTDMSIQIYISYMNIMCSCPRLRNADQSPGT